MRFPRHELVPRHSHGVACQFLTSSPSDDQAWDGVNPLGRREVFAERVFEGYCRPRHPGMVLGHGFLVAVEANKHDLERLVLCLRLGVQRRQLGCVLAAGSVLLKHSSETNIGRRSEPVRSGRGGVEARDDCEDYPLPRASAKTGFYRRFPLPGLHTEALASISLYPQAGRPTLLPFHF